jgi:hypothetical protein
MRKKLEEAARQANGARSGAEQRRAMLEAERFVKKSFEVREYRC